MISYFVNYFNGCEEHALKGFSKATLSVSLSHLARLPCSILLIFVFTLFISVSNYSSLLDTITVSVVSSPDVSLVSHFIFRNQNFLEI